MTTNKTNNQEPIKIRGVAIDEIHDIAICYYDDYDRDFVWPEYINIGDGKWQVKYHNPTKGPMSCPRCGGIINSKRHHDCGDNIVSTEEVLSVVDAVEEDYYKFCFVTSKAVMEAVRNNWEKEYC